MFVLPAMFALMALLALFLIVLPALSAPLALRALHADNSACFAFAASIAVCLLLAFLCLLLCASPGCSACSAWFALSALLALPYYALICLQSLHACFACSVPGRLTVPVLACSANLPPQLLCWLCLPTLSVLALGSAFFVCCARSVFFTQSSFCDVCLACYVCMPPCSHILHCVLRLLCPLCRTMSHQRVATQENRMRPTPGRVQGGPTCKATPKKQ